MPAWLRLLRPKQWIKNGFVFAPLFFAGAFTDARAWGLTALAALCFLSLSCAVYIGNDMRDAEEDRRHPVKKNRPLAAGTIGFTQAAVMGAASAALALFLLIMLPRGCVLIAFLYLSLNVVYTFYLKHVALLDIFTIAFCYVLRVLMGAYALEVIVSPWIILTTFMLALFLGFGKRYHELGFAEYASGKANLQHYSRALLDRLVTICGCSALLAYAIYAAELASKRGDPALVYTVGFVAFGLFRYLQSIYVYEQGGEPESVILKDKLQLLNLALWLATTLWILF